MIEESLECKHQFEIFTTLIGRKKNIETLRSKLESLNLSLQENNKALKVEIFETTFYQGKTIR